MHHIVISEMKTCVDNNLKHQVNVWGSILQLVHTEGVLCTADVSYRATIPVQDETLVKTVEQKCSGVCITKFNRILSHIPFSPLYQI